MGNSLKGKVAVVTGSGQGIGKAIAIELAKEGAKVVTNNRKPNSTDVTNLVGYDINSLNKARQEKLMKGLAELGGDAESTAAEIKKLGGEAVPFYGDVSNFKVAGNLIQTAIDSWGKIDILVNNAGTFRYANCWDMSEEIWDTVTLNKPKSYFNCVRHAAPYMMKQKWGRIINTSSPAWLGSSMENCNYCAANAGVVGYTWAIARELYPYGITCNAFAPGALTRATVTVLARWEKEDENGIATDKARTAAFEKAAPAEALAPFIAYLATEEAKDVTGSVFRVGGGHIGMYSIPVEIATLDKKEGMWTVDELKKVAPKELFKGYKNFAQK
jgi:3-oxoacyl-[acyl-carrier protein] reductase